MNISPLAIHFTSLCLDVVHEKSFLNLNQRDINALYPDVKELVGNRIISWVGETKTSTIFVHQVTMAIISVLHSCRKKSGYRQANWIMYQFEKLIDSVMVKH